MRLATSALLLLIAVILSSCSSGVQSAKSHVQEIAPPPRTGDPGQDLEACSRTIERMDPLAKDPYSELLRAAVYHRMHEIDAAKTYRGGDDIFRARCPGAGAILGTTGEPPDLLAMSFRVVVTLRSRSGTIDDAELADWILVEKELAIADFLRREAALGSAPIDLRCREEVPPEWIDLHVRVEGFAMAAIFYQRAAKIASDRKLDDGRGLAGLQASSRELHAAAAALAAWPGRAPSFGALWKGVGERSAAVLGSDEPAAWLAYSPHDPPIVHHFDLAAHLQEGRDLILRAEEERMGGKPDRSLASFEAALRHCLFAWFIAPAEVRDDRDRVAIWLDTTFASLHRLTWAGADRERELVVCAEALGKERGEPTTAADRLRLAAILRRVYAAGPREVLANAGQATRERCAVVAPYLEAPGPLAKAGALAVQAWASLPPGADVPSDDRVHALLAVADAVLERPRGGDGLEDWQGQPAGPQGKLAGWQGQLAGRILVLGDLQGALGFARRADAAFVRAEGKSSPAALAEVRRAAQAIEGGCAELRGESARVSGLDRVLDDLVREVGRLKDVPETPLEPDDAEWRPDADDAARRGGEGLEAARAEPFGAERLAKLLRARGWIALAAQLREFAGAAPGPEASAADDARAEVTGMLPRR